MCGISGFSATNRNIEDLKFMTGCIAHRGPDADGFYFDEQSSTALGHRRLSILDLSQAANQPFYSKDKRYVMVYNGEVFNYKEIAAELNIQTQTTSDTEVIIEAFAKEGPAFVNRLNGMFAFAIFDQQEKLLYLFRDRVGIKPLFYFQKAGELLFASEIKAITGLPDFQKTLNRRAIYNYLHLGYIPEPDTAFEGIKKFPAGAYAVYNGKDLKIESYWKPEEKIKSNTLKDFKQAKEEFKALIESSVKYRMISDVPYGTFLSGGIDSSLVTAVAQKHSVQPVKTFSIGFKEAKHNEAHHAKAIADYLGTNHHEMFVSYKEAMRLTEEIIDVYDEPFADSSAIPTMLVSKMARAHVTMTLSGDGGDELFMGYGAYKWAERMNNPFVKALGSLPGKILSSGVFPDKYKRAGNLFYSGKHNLESHIFSQEQYLFSQKEIQEFTTLSGFDFSPEIASVHRKLSAREQQALFDLKYYLKDDLLVKVDRASMKYSLETRVPLLDYRIVEFALNLDEQIKIKNGTLKYFLKEVLYDYVPKNLLERPKQGFSIPLSQWMKKELKYLVSDHLNTTVVKRFGLVDPKKVQELIKRFEQGENYLYNRLWCLVILHKFLEKNF
jgi:asparagine synthase (glutamine-hydrolysing)